MVQEISPQELHDMLHSDDDVILIDVLAPEYFRKQHIPKAINIPGEHIEALITEVAEHHRPIVVYCYNTECQASPTVAKQLKELGYEHVYDLEVGIEGYKKAGFAVTTY